MRFLWEAAFCGGTLILPHPFAQPLEFGVVRMLNFELLAGENHKVLGNESFAKDI